MDKITIVVTSYNMERLKDIYDVLDSIKFQTYGNIETVYIVERSEELYKSVKEYSESIKLPINLIFRQEKIGLCGARNLGSQKANGEIVAFIDDDVVLDHNWAKMMVETYSEDVIGVTGSAYPLWQDKELAWFPKELYWLFSCSNWVEWDKITETDNLWGCNMSFRKEAFEVGSFLQELGNDYASIGDDLEFSIRVRIKTGKKLLFNPKVIIGHKVRWYRTGLNFIKKRSYHIGSSRRLFKSTYLRDYTSLHKDKKVANGIIRTILYLYKDNPKVALQKILIISTVLFYFSAGYMFPHNKEETIKLINEVGL